jgi:hypothetical protein
MPTRERSLEQIGLGIMHRLTIDKICLSGMAQCVDGFDQRGLPDLTDHTPPPLRLFFDVGRAVVEHLHGAARTLLSFWAP